MCSSLNLSTLDQYSTSETSYCSHRETSYAVQSDTRLFEYDERILYQKSLRVYEKKLSDIIVMLFNDITGVPTYSVTWSDETVYYTRFINDDLVNPILSNTTQTNTRGNPTYFDLQEYLKSGSQVIVHPYMHRIVRESAVSILLMSNPTCAVFHVLHAQGVPTSILLIPLVQNLPGHVDL
jgi:hypothetical protein